jgi:hypothetical protein
MDERDDYDEPPPGPSAVWVWAGIALVGAVTVGWLLWDIVSALTTQEN